MSVPEAMETKLAISAPIMSPFTINLPYEVSMDSPKLKKQGCKVWVQFKSQRFWVFFAIMVILFVLAFGSLVVVFLYFMVQHQASLTSPSVSAIAGVSH